MVSKCSLAENQWKHLLRDQQSHSLSRSASEFGKPFLNATLPGDIHTLSICLALTQGSGLLVRFEASLWLVASWLNSVEKLVLLYVGLWILTTSCSCNVETYSQYVVALFWLCILGIFWTRRNVLMKLSQEVLSKTFKDAKYLHGISVLCHKY